MRTWRRAQLAAAAALVGLGVVSSGVAYADSGNVGKYSTAYVDGSGYLDDDFGDHRGELGSDLCYGCSNSSNTDAVLLWQSFLVAEGFIGYSGLDGNFGPATRDATKKWQSRYGLTADGRVGNATWGRADNILRWDDGFVRYPGRDGKSVVLERGWNYQGQTYGAYDLLGIDVSGSRRVSFTNSAHIWLKARTYDVLS
ncbi:peptidoglycan-binding domain-containing protein [Kribbella shirazensis]|uniref:Peptidoglycan hydrolase-like protein with peptidoglycan-binding domain n=1 Tax=Kribbella shirazensis TaxID=1105143 RepID=A0A7X5VJP1_9ACTN|nr:peptidoglycan-binding domain-containing protein [Kribbella shirazensis]NIK61657.1 peptidoglycan hydrolase-like protein with peptidoglycan-binding domain [Kribbella shirazensis]